MKKRLALVLAIVMMLLLLTGCGKGGNYKKALALYEGGQYDEAAAVFLELGDYENSQEMVKVCRYRAANALFDAGSFDEAKNAFQDLGDYENSVEMAKKSGYEAAKVLFAAGSYEEAKAAFEALGDYGDSVEMAKKSGYEAAKVLFAAGSYEEAKVAFEALGDYEDSADCAAECDYQRACALFDAGDYEAAAAIFETIKDHGDSAEKLAAANRELMHQKYGDVLLALDGNTWYFNGGGDTILNKISFSGDVATIAQVYFDGNGKHDNGSKNYSFVVNDQSIVVTMTDGSDLEIPYALSGKTITLGHNQYFTIEEVDAGLQGYWNTRYSNVVLGILCVSDKNMYINKGTLTSENAALKAGSKTGEYYYYGPFTGSYKLNFGGFDTDMSHGSEWFFNIINGKVTLLNYGHVCTPASKLPGPSGYKF